MLTFQTIFSFFRTPANSRAITTFWKVCERFAYVQRKSIKKSKSNSVQLKENYEYTWTKSKDQPLSIEPLAPATYHYNISCLSHLLAFTMSPTVFKHHSSFKVKWNATLPWNLFYPLSRNLHHRRKNRVTWPQSVSWHSIPSLLSFAFLQLFMWVHASILEYTSFLPQNCIYLQAQIQILNPKHKKSHYFLAKDCSGKR